MSNLSLSNSLLKSIFILNIKNDYLIFKFNKKYWFSVLECKGREVGVFNISKHVIFKNNLLNVRNENHARFTYYCTLREVSIKGIVQERKNSNLS